MNKEKTCTKCKTAYPFTEKFFHRDNTKPDGFHQHCKKCRRSNSSKYFLTHQESILEKNKKWKDENADRIRVTNRLWQQNNPDAVKLKKERFKLNHPKINTEYHRRWVQKNRDKTRKIDAKRRATSEFKEKVLRYREKNRDLFRTYAGNRYHREKNAGTVTPEDIKRIYAEQSGLCFWCSKSVGTDYHLDHVIPLIRGGSNTPENCVISCPTCNVRKNSLIPYKEWIPPNPLVIS